VISLRGVALWLLLLVFVLRGFGCVCGCYALGKMFCKNKYINRYKQRLATSNFLLPQLAAATATGS
jgi:hypothetical protein